MPVTDVAFHFNAPDKLAYACRLLRKAVASGSQVVVTAQAHDLEHLDALLWTFSAQDFVPHALASATAEVLAASPVVLSESLSQLPHRQVLLNLGHVVPDGFEQFERLIDVVSLDDADRQSARVRWKQYTTLGYSLTRYDLNLKGTT
jgi:DNA polymerase III subunit chi